MKYISKKLKRDNIKKVILRALDLVEYLVKNGTMRVVLEIKEEKHQIKSLRKMLAGDDEMEFVELSTILSDIVTKKCDTILEIIADEKRLEEEREQAGQLRNRIKGTGNSRGFGSYGGYSSENYDAVGSDSRKKKRDDDPYRGYGGNSYGSRDRDRERERDRDRDYGGSTAGGRYDAHQGQSNLMKKLGIASESAKPEEKDDDIEFPEDDQPSKLTAPPKKEEIKPAPAFTKPTGGAKFLPPPPSKGGNGTTITTNPTQASPSTGGNDPFDLLGGDLVVTPSPKTPVTQASTPQQNLLLGSDFTSTQTAPTQTLGSQFNLLGGTAAPPTQNFGNQNLQQNNNLLGGGMGGGFGNNNGFGAQPTGNNTFGGSNGMGGLGGGFNGMGTAFVPLNQLNFNGGMGGMGSFPNNNGGFGGMGGAQQGMNQQQSSFGMGQSTTGTSYGTSGQQNKKLITFDAKPTPGNEDYAAFPEMRPKTIDEIGLAGLADLSKLSEEAKKQQSKKNEPTNYNFIW